MLRLGILPTGWIYPKKDRAVRDLLRRRSQLVRQRTASRLGLRNVLERTTARRLSTNALKKLTRDDLAGWIEDENGHIVWMMEYDETVRAGGARKNREFNGQIKLPKGKYTARYETDDSHSYNRWNSSEPDDAIHYGLTLTVID